MSYFNVLLALRNSLGHLLRAAVQPDRVFADFVALIPDSADLIKLISIDTEQWGPLYVHIIPWHWGLTQILWQKSLLPFINSCRNCGHFLAAVLLPYGALYCIVSVLTQSANYIYQMIAIHSLGKYIHQAHSWMIHPVIRKTWEFTGGSVVSGARFPLAAAGPSVLGCAYNVCWNPNI